MMAMTMMTSAIVISVVIRRIVGPVPLRPRALTPRRVARMMATHSATRAHVHSAAAGATARLHGGSDCENCRKYTYCRYEVEFRFHELTSRPESAGRSRKSNVIVT